MDLEGMMRAIASEAQRAAHALAASDAAMRDGALIQMAAALKAHEADIIAANAVDVEKATERGTKASLVDRLLLDEGRIQEMASALEDLTRLPDPRGCVQEERELYNGLQLARVSVPLGVVCVIYEARPNVTADAAGICLKSGNACILRGGSLAAHSNEVIANILADAASQAGLPRTCIQAVTTTDRAATDVLLKLHGLIDVIVPRGGAGLIAHCVETAKVPVIETGTGNCHVYVHESADPAMAASIVENAKCRRYGVCNAAETLLVDESAADEALPPIFAALASHGVALHADPPAFAQARAWQATSGVPLKLFAATEEDWEREYLAPEMAIRCVSGEDEAIEHINRYGTGHSEAIVAADEDVIARFFAAVDAAAVYANASTAFTDGGQFGLGAEIGISTQKLHVRGPFALEALTSYKYLIKGSGQVRA